MSVALAVGLLAAVLITRLTAVEGPTPISAEAKEAARQAGCSGILTPSSEPRRGHKDEGPIEYSQRPASSGVHRSQPLPTSPHVYQNPVDESKAVHNLEHGQILVYYRATGPDRLSSSTISTLESVAESSKNTIMSPYADLPSGTSLAVVAWNKVQTCPTMSAGQAKTVVTGFTDAFACTSNAPEPQVSGNGC